MDTPSDHKVEEMAAALRTVAQYHHKAAQYDEMGAEAHRRAEVHVTSAATMLRNLQAEKELWRKSVSESAGIHFTQRRRIATLQAEVDGWKAGYDAFDPLRKFLAGPAQKPEHLGKHFADIAVEEIAALQAKLDIAVHALREMHRVESYNDELTCAALSRLDTLAPDGDCQHCKGEGCVACDARHLPKKPCSESAKPPVCDECGGKGCEFCTTGTREPYIGADPGMEVGGTTHKRLSTEEEGYGL